MKSVLAIMGSPRKKMNTNQALDYILNGINDREYEVKKIFLRDLDIKYCTGCNYCSRKAGCIQKDDMQSVYRLIDDADIIIFAAPLYFNSLNGLSKNVIDRCQKYWGLKYSLGEDYKREENRKGIFLSTGGSPWVYDQFLGTKPVLELFFKSINVEYLGNCFISNTDTIPVFERQDIEKELTTIGEDISNLEHFTIHK